MSDRKVEIYVRSSPLGEVGIHWRNISKSEQPREEPVVLKERVIARDDGQQVTINSLINDTKPSLILARYQNKLLLELTGLDATEARSNKMGRRISEIVLWVGDASETTESQLRKLAASALLSFWKKESTFLTTIRTSIDFDELNSFKADVQQIEKLYTDPDKDLDNLLSKVSPSVINTSESFWSIPQKIHKESQLYDLVREISETSLPETEQPVVVVAEFKKEGDQQQINYKGNVWVEKKRPAPIPETVPIPEPAATPEPVSPPKSRPAILRMLLLILIIVLAIWLVAQSRAITPNQKPYQKQPSSKISRPQSYLQVAKSPILPKNQP